MLGTDFKWEYFPQFKSYPFEIFGGNTMKCIGNKQIMSKTINTIQQTKL